jgi:hypothetical protein
MDKEALQEVCRSGGRIRKSENNGGSDNEEIDILFACWYIVFGRL